MYNWYTVNTGKLAPVEWRVPDTTDWRTLENYLSANGYNYNGTQKMIAKSMAATVWNVSTIEGAIGNNLNTNNKSGFSALPGGYRAGNGYFLAQSGHGYWWCTTETNATNASSLRLSYDSVLVGVGGSGTDKFNGFSVRLVRDLN